MGSRKTIVRHIVASPRNLRCKRASYLKALFLCRNIFSRWFRTKCQLLTTNRHSSGAVPGTDISKLSVPGYGGLVGWLGLIRFSSMAEDAAKTSGTVLPTLLNKSSRSSASLRGGSSRTDRSTSISLTGSPTKPGRSAGGSPTETVSVDCSVRGSLNAISCPQCACGAVYISLPRLSCVPFCHSATRHTFVSVKASAGLARERVVKAR